MEGATPFSPHEQTDEGIERGAEAIHVGGRGRRFIHRPANVVLARQIDFHAGDRRFTRVARAIVVGVEIDVAAQRRRLVTDLDDAVEIVAVAVVVHHLELGDVEAAIRTRLHQVPARTTRRKDFRCRRVREVAAEVELGHRAVLVVRHDESCRAVVVNRQAVRAAADRRPREHLPGPIEDVGCAAAAERAGSVNVNGTWRRGTRSAGRAP